MNVIERIRERLPEFATGPAVIEGERTWTHAQLYDRVDRLSQAFLELGIQKGDVLMAWLPNGHEAIETELACFQIGAIWVTLNTNLTWTEVHNVIASTEPELLVTNPKCLEKIEFAGPEGAPTRLEGAPARPAARLPVCEGLRFILTGETGSTETLDPSFLSYESIIASSRPERPKIDVGEDDIARLRYTSGTTGRAKAAVLPHRVYLASLENLQNELHPLGPSDRVVHAAPLTHASAALIYPILAAGGANVVLPRFDVEAVLECIETQRITTMFAVPTILQRMCASPSFATRDLTSLRTVTYGGAPMAVEKLIPAIERFGTALVQIYGLTEALHPVTTLKREEHWVGNPNLGSIGKPTPINDVRIVDSGGRDLPDGEVGEIWVRGPNVMAGYWRDEAETRLVMKDGWLATGDLAFRNPEGYLRIVDRRKDVIISGGFNVYTKEVELVLCEHEAVLEAAVIGIPHDEWGEAVHAVVVAKPGRNLTEKELLRHCRAVMAGYKTPKSISFEKDPLPKSGAGKILKRELRTPFWETYNKERSHG